MAHTGKLSYVGPRKNGKVRQPYVAEGPNESSDNPESKFWYHTGNIFVTHIDIGPLYMDSAITWCDQQLLLPTTCTDTWPVFILF